MTAKNLKIDVTDGVAVSALWIKPRAALAGYVFAHGAGAGMTHAFMQSMAEQLADCRIATLRYQFPYMESGSRRPDRPAVCHATVRAVVTTARTLLPEVPWIAGGKSFGGRMTSQAQAQAPLAGIVGLAFLGFPWHPAKQPSLQRSEHLDAIMIPMLFMQGARDPMGDADVIAARIGEADRLRSLFCVPDADHGFHVPARSGRSDSEIQAELADTFSHWARRLTTAP